MILLGYQKAFKDDAEALPPLKGRGPYMEDPLEIELPVALQEAKATLAYLARTLQAGILPATPLIETIKKAAEDMESLASRTGAYFREMRNERNNRRFASIKALASRPFKKRRRR